MRPFFMLLWLYPLLELWLLIRIGGVIGAAGVLLLVLLSGALGLAILRRAGGIALLRARAAGVPALALTEGVLLALAGLLLLLPGPLGDAVGLALLLPATRRCVGRRVLGPLARRRAPPRREQDVIEGEYRREDD